MFFAPYYHKQTGEMMEEIGEFTVENVDGYIEPEAKKSSPKKNRIIKIKSPKFTVLKILE